VVTLPVTVRDKHSQIVRNLTKADFVLEEDGRPQSIKYFSQEANLPLTPGLLVDTSLSQRNVLDEERDASRSFLDQMLTQEKDKAFIVHFDREVELLQDLTSSRDMLRKALDALQTPQLDRERSGGDGQSPPGGQRRMRRSGGTLLYDAVFLASDELMKKQQGRKALIILSDGVDRGSKKSLESAIEAAQRADTVVYCILFKGTQPERGAYEQGVAAWEAVGPAVVAAVDGRAAGEAEGAEGSVLHRKRGRTERRFWNEFPKKQVDASSKFPRRNRSVRSIPALPRNCAHSTAWATPRIKRSLRKDITRSS
jgi:VWFA-related protein